MIENYLNSINHYLQAQPHVGIWFAFVVALAESLPLIGTIVPGSITMTVIGILVGRGMLPGFSTLFWATIGALAGDTIGFWLGKYYNERLRTIWPFKNHPTWLTMGEAFFKKHGGKSILIGRFVGPARSSVPLIAGLLKMTWGRFFIATIPSAILWAIAYMLPGVLVGAISLELPKGVTTEFILIALAVIVFLWLIFWAIQRSFVFLAAFFNKLINTCWNSLNRHHNSKFLIRLITNHKNPEDHHQLTMVILASISFLLFITMLTNVIYLGPLTYLNEPLFYFLQSVRTHHADAAFTAITLLGDSPAIFIFTSIIALGLIWKRQWRTLCHLVMLLILASASVHFFKWIIYSPRPTNLAYATTSSSFPSGHTTLSLTILGFCAFLTAQQLPRKFHWVPYTTASVLIFFVAFSRLYLGAHWFSDILSSIFLGFTILLLVITSYRRYSPKTFGSIYWHLFMIAALLIAWGTYTIAHYRTMLHHYAFVWPTKTIYMGRWWDNPTHYLPIYRTDRFGKPIQPFNVQWADTLTDIKQNLIQQGWVVIHNRTDLKTALGRFASHKPEQHFPIFPQLYRHKPPILFMIKHLPKQQTIIELRLWASGVIFRDSNLPLWVASINYHTAPKHLIELKKPHEITLTDTGGIDTLKKDLSNYRWKAITISSEGQPKRVAPLNWNGSILVIRARMFQPRDIMLGMESLQKNYKDPNRSNNK